MARKSDKELKLRENVLRAKLLERLNRERRGGAFAEDILGTLRMERILKRAVKGPPVLVEDPAGLLGEMILFGVPVDPAKVRFED